MPLETTKKESERVKKDKNAIYNHWWKIRADWVWGCRKQLWKDQVRRGKEKLLLAGWLFLCLDSDQLYASYIFKANNRG